MAKANRKAPKAIPQDVKRFLIALAMMEGRLRRTSTAIQVWHDRIEAKMPGGSRLARKPGLVAALIQEHNRHCARTGAGVSIPTWIVKQRNGVKAV
jgi:hypothetical protein